MSEQREVAAKGLRVMNSVDPCVLKSNFLDVLVTLKQCENVAVKLIVTSPSNQL